METVKSESDLNFNCYDSGSDSYYSDYEEDTTNTRRNSNFKDDMDNEVFDPIHEYKTNQSIANNIICIQMLNNNQIFINYDPSWTLRDVRK